MVKVLVIEDEIDLREDLVDELQEKGYQTIEAENGREGLQALLALRPDLILCDRKMPVMSGYEFLKALRRDHPKYANIPFIFISALSDPGNIMLADLRPSDYITKPVDFEALMAKVKHMVGEPVGKLGSITGLGLGR